MPETNPPPSKPAATRIAKAMADAGLCSRREAERWIEAGRVSVNGQILATPACVVGPADKVIVDGKPLGGATESRLWLYHKPKGLLTTQSDPEGRPTLFEHLPKGMPRVVSVGRLDMNSEGLILLTTDGALARHLELPSTGLARTYRVRVFMEPDTSRLAELRRGITIDGMRYGAIDAGIESVKGDNCWLRVSITEGKNREIRKIFEHLGHPVSRLIRVGYGPFTLGSLPPGEVTEMQMRKWKKLLAY